MAGNTTRGIDLSDVPPVSVDNLAFVIGLMIEAERSLMLLKGATKADRALIERAFRLNFEGATAVGVATLLRFWSLVDAFQVRRMRALFMQRGYEILGPAAKAAASLRLNMDWGFNPQRLIWALGPAQPISMRFVAAGDESEAANLEMAA